MTLNKILAVDDSELLHRMYDLVLMRYSMKGTRILHAMNGHEAFKQLASNPDTDMVLLDINMPLMSGLEFLGKLRAQPVFDHVAVIVISTEGKEADARTALDAGAQGYLTKPFQPNGLHELILRVMQTRLSVQAPAF